MVLKCVTTVTYYVLVNGEPGGVIQPTRGLRQGNPISPYLFIFIFVEGSSSLINATERRGVIKRVAVSRGGIRISHLLFVGDCLIFGRAKMNEWQKIQGLLKVYEEATGQCLNLQKTTFFSNSKIEMQTRQ